MNNEHLFEKWKKQKRSVEISPDFTDKVMTQLYQYEQKKSAPLWDLRPFFEFISTNPLAKLALYVSGGILGLARIVCIVSMFLKPSG